MIKNILLLFVFAVISHSGISQNFGSSVVVCGSAIDTLPVVASSDSVKMKASLRTSASCINPIYTVQDVNHSQFCYSSGQVAGVTPAFGVHRRSSYLTNCAGNFSTVVLDFSVGDFLPQDFSFQIVDVDNTWDSLLINVYRNGQKVNYTHSIYANSYVNVFGSSPDLRLVGTGQSNASPTSNYLSGVIVFQVDSLTPVDSIVVTHFVKNNSGMPSGPSWTITEVSWNDTFSIQDNTISGSVFKDKNVNQVFDSTETGLSNPLIVYLYEDVNDNGVVDLEDQIPIDSILSTNDGLYSFSQEYRGGTKSYFVSIDSASLPLNSSLTTDNIEYAAFSEGGNSDIDNDFGYNDIAVGCQESYPSVVAQFEGFVQNTSSSLGVADGVGARFYKRDSLLYSRIVWDMGETVPAGTEVCVSVKLLSCVSTSSSSSNFHFWSDVDSVNPANAAYTRQGGLQTFSNTNWREICVVLNADARYFKVVDAGGCEFELDYVKWNDCTLPEVNKISGTLWEDVNHNQVREMSESLLSNVKVYRSRDVNANGVLDFADVLLDSAMSNSVGYYEFDSILYDCPSSCNEAYILYTDINAFGKGYRLSTNSARSVVFTSGNNHSEYNDFGVTPPNMIEGVVFTDYNGNGVLDNSETPYDSVSIYIYNDANSNGVLDLAESIPFDTAFTDINGAYQFVVEYTGGVASFLIESDTATYPIGSYNTTGNLESASFSSGGNIDDDNEFGFDGENAISGNVFLDYNEDGVLANGETGTENIWVYLYKDVDNDSVIDIEDRTAIDSVQSNSLGFYIFDVSYDQLTESYFISSDTTNLPTGSYLTTDNYEYAQFTSGGNVDPNNDFGHSGCDFESGIAAPLTGCTGEDQVFAVSPPVSGATYAWVFPSGSPATSTVVTQMVNWSTAGTYEVELAVSDATCTDTISHSIVINTGVTASAAPSDTVCRGGEAVLDASASTASGANYLWTVESGDPFSIDAGGSTTAPTVSPYINTVYKLTVTSATSMCANVAFVSVNVDVNLNPNASLSGPTGAINDSSMVFLDGTGSFAPVTNSGAAMNYTWLEDGAAMSPWNNDTLTTEVSGTTEYGIVCIDPLNGCADTAYVTVTPTLPPVPVELIGLKAKLQGTKDVLVAWSTATELNNEKFEVQRRYEYEVDFTTIGEVLGAGNSSTTKSYTYTDRENQWLSPVVYYRLKQIDYDGTTENTYAVPISKQSDLELMVYPNPMQDETMVAAMGVENIESLVIMDLYGKNISGEVAMEKDNGIYTLDVRALRNGTYYIEVRTKTQRATHKVLVAR